MRIRPRPILQSNGTLWRAHLSCLQTCHGGAAGSPIASSRGGSGCAKVYPARARSHALVRTSLNAIQYSIVAWRKKSMPQVPAVGVEVHWTIVVRVVTVERALAAHRSDGATASETASSSSRSRCVMPEVGSLALPLPRLPLPLPLPRRPPADERVQGTFAHPLVPPRDEADGGVRSPPVARPR